MRSIRPKPQRPLASDTEGGKMPLATDRSKTLVQKTPIKGGTPKIDTINQKMNEIDLSKLQ